MLYLHSSNVFELEDNISPLTSDSMNHGGISEGYTPTREDLV